MKMTAAPAIRQARTKRLAGNAFTLIEMIGVLVIIAILAAILLPALLRQMDRIAGEQESTSLKAFGNALQQSILRNRAIPTYTDWASVVAAELGSDVANVTTNQSRKQPRFFLIDPSLNINGAGLPFTQGNAGSANSPVSPRVLLISSIGRALPVGIVSGVASAADFTNIWNATDGAVPAAPSFAGWNGSGDDVRVQRINLAPLFVRLLLTAYASHGNPYYSIDSTNLGTALAVTNNSWGRDAYFIQNSVLSLYTHGPIILDSQQILIRDSSFVYNLDVWRSSIIGSSTVGGLDVGTVADKFLKAPHNLNANVPNGTNQQAVILTNMMVFMSAYGNWATANFPNTALKTTAENAQSAMLDSVRKIYEPGGGGNDYTPWNTNACIP